MSDNFTHDRRTSRRPFLKKVATVGGLAASGTLAGCSGDGGGNGGGDGGGSDGDGGGGNGADGGADGSDGDGTDGGDGGSTTQMEEISVSAAIPPLGHYRAMFDHFESEGIYDSMLSEYGIGDFEINLTWEDVPLFASGQVDIGYPGLLAAANLAMENDLNFTITGSILNQWQGLQMKLNGPYFIEPEGDRYSNEEEKQIIDSVKADGDPSAPVGIGTWSGGSVDIMQWLWPEMYGHEFNEDNFQVVVAGYPQQPQLIDRGRVAVGQGTPVAGAADDIIDGKLAAVHYHFQWLDDLGKPEPPLNNIVARDSFVQENPQAMVGITEMMNTGLEWIHENADDIKEREGQQEAWGYDGRQDAVRLVYDYITGDMRANWEGEIHSSHLTDLPALPSDGTLTEDLVASEKEAANVLVEAGLLQDGWQDHITYTPHTEL